jgi:glucokinase
MLLAGDLGGTKTLLGLFSRAPARPAPIAVETFRTTEYASLVEMVDAFLSRQPEGRPPIEGACFGVAGPVIDDESEITNVGWRVDGRAVAIEFGLARVRLLNDLVAIAHSVSVLEPHELYALQEGEPNLSGNAALIAAGTGMGQSYLFNDGRRLVPAPSEAGHVDFAPRTPREMELTAWLTARRGRAEVEQVISGLGLVNLYEFTHPSPCHGVGVNVGVNAAGDAAGIPALLSTNAMAGTCEHCREALDLFVSAYGSEAGNLALRAVATRGIYVGGGIAPKILPALETGLFLESFEEKPPMTELLKTIPVKVILNPQAGLIGAATVANQSAG